MVLKYIPPYRLSGVQKALRKTTEPVVLPAHQMNIVQDATLLSDKMKLPPKYSANITAWKQVLGLAQQAQGSTGPFFSCFPRPSLLTALPHTLKGCALSSSSSHSQNLSLRLWLSQRPPRVGDFHWQRRRAGREEGSGGTWNWWPTYYTVLMKPHIAGRGRMRKLKKKKEWWPRSREQN